MIAFNRPDSLKANFKKPGKNDYSFRSVTVTGPSIIGEITSTHLCAKSARFSPIEPNASDARSKKLVEAITNNINIQNTTLDRWRGEAFCDIAHLHCSSTAD